VHDAGDVAQDRQQDVDPELWPDADLQEDTERGEQDRVEDAQRVHGVHSWGEERAGGYVARARNHRAAGA
jgi:hypothetical protein